MISPRAPLEQLIAEMRDRANYDFNFTHRAKELTLQWAEALALVLGPQLESEREQIAAYVESCREPRDYVQVFDVLAKHIREGRHLAAALGHAGSPSRGRQ